MCMHRRNVLSLTLALSRMRSDNIAIMSRDPLWRDSWLMFGVAIRRNWCLVIFSNKGNHYERLSLRASLVLPHHTTQYIYTYAVALFKTHSENYQDTRARQNGRSKMCHLQVAWRQPREDERLVSICSL